MLSFSILWVMIAAAVIVMALVRRSRSDAPDHADSPASGSGNGLAFIAVLSSLLLLAGFLYVGSSLVLNL